MNQSACKICSNVDHNTFHVAKEMMFGFGGSFGYLKCANCGCLQLLDIPSDIAAYYPSHYYSYSSEGEGYVVDPSLKTKIKKSIKRLITSHYKVKPNIGGMFFSIFVKDSFPWLRKGLVDLDTKILDVGCGAGYLLLNMRFNGFRNLEGIDPFIEDTIHYKSGVTVYKKEIFDVEGSFGMIMMHHSFEHMDQPKLVLQKLYDLLEPGGHALISIPVSDSYAWRKYGVNWVQLDAPRHFYLHTTSSIQTMASEIGFELVDVLYNATSFQFAGSELYLHGKSLHGGSLTFSAAEQKAFKSAAKRLNELRDGDSAVFYLKK